MRVAQLSFTLSWGLHTMFPKCHRKRALKTLMPAINLLNKRKGQAITRQTKSIMRYFTVDRAFRNPSALFKHGFCSGDSKNDIAPS